MAFVHIPAGRRVWGLLTGFLLTLITFLCFVSCSPILSERIYDAIRIGSADTFFDDFEDNNTRKSDRYTYSGEATLSREWSRSGSWSMNILTGGSLNFTVKPTAAATVSFATNESSFLQATVDGSFVPLYTATSGDNYWEMYFEVPAGTHAIAIFPEVYTRYVDDLSCAYASGSISPSADEVRFMGPSFAWPAATWAESQYEFQLSRQADMGTLDLDVKDLPGPAYTYPSILADGKWYWRTRIKTSGNWGAWSPIRRFSKVNASISRDVSDIRWSFSDGRCYGDALDPTGGPDGGYSIAQESADAQMEGTFPGPCLLSFEWTTMSAYVLLDGEPQSWGMWKTSSADWYQGFVPILTAGRHMATFKYSYDPQKRIGSLEIIPYIAPVAENFDGEGLASTSYRLLGTGNATISTEESRSGGHSLSLAGDSEGSSFVMPVCLEAPATLSFYAKNSTAAGNSYLRVKDAGHSELVFYLGTTWTKYSMPLSAGCHTLLFDYSLYDKSTGYRAYVDDIAFE